MERGMARVYSNMDTMDVFTLARTGARVEGERPLALMPRLAASLTASEGVLRYACEGSTDALGRPALRLHLQARLPVRCDRCGRALALALDAERQFFFVATEQELAAIPIDDSPQEPLLGSAHFDLAGLLEDEAILQLPISPRHADCVAPYSAGASATAAADRGPAGGSVAGFDDAPADARRPFARLAGLREQLQAAAVPAAVAPPDGDIHVNAMDKRPVTAPRRRRSRRGTA